MNNNRLETRDKREQAGIARLSARLLTVAGPMRQGSYIADVGTDHDCIPVYLARARWISSALAVDVRYGPLEKARTHAREYQAWERARRQAFPAVPIRTRLSDDLKGLKPGEVDTIIMTGMGGEPIIKIPDRGHHAQDSVEQYTFSPQSDLNKVRRYLAGRSFAIEDEAMIKDEGKYYTVMSVKRGFTEHENQAHYLYGRLLTSKKDIALREYLDRRTFKIEKVLRLLQGEEGIADTKTRVEARISRQKELSRIKETQDEV